MASKIKVDVLETVSGSGNIVLNNALSGDGSSLTGVGKVLQIVYVLNGTGATGTTNMAVDNTTPQITEGDEYYTLAITPASTSNILGSL